jgi:hypothetical protein
MRITRRRSGWRRSEILERLSAVKKSVKFTGELLKPIEIKTQRVTILTDTPEHRAEVEKHNFNEYARAWFEQFKKLEALQNAFGLVKKAGEDPLIQHIRLAMALASEFVPGFRVKDLSFEKGKGRAQEWDALKYCQLIADVGLVVGEKACSESEACRILSTSSRFASRWKKYGKRTLENRLVKAKREDDNVMITIFRHPEIESRLGRDRVMEIVKESFSITLNKN